MNVGGVVVPVALVFDTIEGILVERKKAKKDSANDRKLPHHGMAGWVAGSIISQDERPRGKHEGGEKIGVKKHGREQITSHWQWVREAPERRRMELGAQICAHYQNLSRKV